MAKRTSSKAQVEVGWFDRGMLSLIFGVPVTSLWAALQQIRPDDVCTPPGKKRYYRAAAVHAMLLNAACERSAASLRKEIAGLRRLQDGDAELLPGEDGSEALERYRRIRAIREEFAHGRDLGHWLPRDAVRTGLLRIAEVYRRAYDQLQREYGTAALELLSEAQSDAGKMIDELFPAPADVPGRNANGACP